MPQISRRARNKTLMQEIKSTDTDGLTFTPPLTDSPDVIVKRGCAAVYRRISPENRAA
jgi:hypothetical protein